MELLLWQVALHEPLENATWTNIHKVLGTERAERLHRFSPTDRAGQRDSEFHRRIGKRSGGRTTNDWQRGLVPAHCAERIEKWPARGRDVWGVESTRNIQ